MKIGFDNQKYLSMQSEHIMDRLAQFGGKLYLEENSSTTFTLPACCRALSLTARCACFSS